MLRGRAVMSDDEPGIDLSEPAPSDPFDQYKTSIMEMLETKTWLDLKVETNAGPTMPFQTYGSPIVVWT